MLIKILIALAIVIAIFVVVVALRPSDFRVTRSATIAAPASIVFGQVNNLHRWQDWSPWAKVDPNAKLSYSGPEEGVGAGYAWAGSKVGEGQMDVIESKPNDLVRFKLHFIKPFQATNLAEFTFRPDGGNTVVNWSMTGKNNFLFKAVGLFMDCDKMCGDQFEQGLAQLKTISEIAAQKH